jgi:hypothetical protein
MANEQSSGRKDNFGMLCFGKDFNLQKMCFDLARLRVFFLEVLRELGNLEYLNIASHSAYLDAACFRSTIVSSICTVDFALGFPLIWEISFLVLGRFNLYLRMLQRQMCPRGLGHQLMGRGTTNEPGLNGLHSMEDKELCVTMPRLELSDVGLVCTDLSTELHLTSPNCFSRIQLGWEAQFDCSPRFSGYFV